MLEFQQHMWHSITQFSTKETQQCFSRKDSTDFGKTNLIVKIHFQTAINATAASFMQKLALRPTASEATTSAK